MSSATEKGTQIEKILMCPVHRRELRFDLAVDFSKGVPFPDGQISCRSGCNFAIEGGIPRFTPQNNYAAAFGLQWQRYQKTQLDSYTGIPYSRQRLERCLGMPLEALRGKVVLECGAGAGRFTELLVDNCALLVALDLSDAVDANLKNCAGKTPYVLCQADINKSPLPHGFFDVVICLGVIQHTPSPEQTITSLASHVKRGGLLVMDHYRRCRLHSLREVLSVDYPLRAILKRLNRRLSLKITIALTAICDPILKRACKVPWLYRIAGQILPSACYYNSYPLLDPDIVYEWNELDTHDRLTSYYRHFRTPEEIRSCLLELGFRDIDCNLAGNGIEVQAVYQMDEPVTGSATCEKDEATSRIGYFSNLRQKV